MAAVVGKEPTHTVPSTGDPLGRLAALALCQALCLLSCQNQQSAEPIPDQVGVVRFMEHQDRLQFRSESEPARVAADLPFEWGVEGLAHIWKKTDVDGWITLASPPLPFQSLSEIEEIGVQLAEPADCRISFHWSENSELSESDLLRNKVELDRLPGAQSRFVRGETQSDVLAGGPPTREPVPRHIFLRWRKAEDCKIDRVQIRSTKSVLAAHSHGVFRLNRGGEIRNSLYIRTPGTISYAATAAMSGTLRFGLATQAGSKRARIRLEASRSDASEVLLKSRVSAAEGWEDFFWSVSSIPRIWSSRTSTNRKCLDGSRAIGSSSCISGGQSARNFSIWKTTRASERTCIRSIA